MENKIICELYLNDELVKQVKYNNDNAGRMLANDFFHMEHYKGGRLNITVNDHKIVKKYRTKGE